MQYVWFLAAALILAYSAVAIFSSLFTPAKSEQGQLLPESLILCYLVSHENHHDGVPWCFHHKLLLLFICLRHGAPVDFLPSVLMPMTLIQYTVTVELSNLHTFTSFNLEFINAKSWVG